MGDITCITKGMTYQFLNGQSILFGRTFGRAVDIVTVCVEAENLTLEKSDEIMDKIEKHEQPFQLDGNAHAGWQDDPGINIYRLSGRFNVIEQLNPEEEE